MRILAVVAALVIGAWSWPVTPHEVVRAFDLPETPYGAGHRGIDIAAAAGAAVLSPDDGVVRFAGAVAGRPVVSIDHAGGLVSSFEPVEPSVVAGERVARGQRIGVLLPGHGGGSRLHADVLHLGARLRGAYVDPLPLLGVARPVLLPMDGRAARSPPRAVTPEDARRGRPRRAARATRACRSASCRGSRGPASPAPP